MDLRDLTPALSVSGQIGPEDLEALADAGFTDIVCNRPDAELPDGPHSDEMAARAGALGLGFHYLPIEPGGPMARQAERLARLTGQPGARVLAYCRSGARSSAAWALTLPGTPSAA